jgi:cytosine/adenosine deaminase-related metal-dependent hydrolase
VTALRLSADWVITMDGAPIRGGAVVIDGGGRITDIAAPGEEGLPEVAASVSQAPKEGSLPRQTVLLPGLVNAHSHLELTGLDGKVTEEEFPAWIAHLTRLWRERRPEE